MPRSIAKLFDPIRWQQEPVVDNEEVVPGERTSGENQDLGREENGSEEDEIQQVETQSDDGNYSPPSGTPETEVETPASQPQDVEDDMDTDMQCWFLY
eukprot:NP_510629.1 Uncharacterized protein CELE_T27A8.4 [Caenorhabditis elegans]